MYSQLCVVQYWEFGRWSLVVVKFCPTTSSPNTVHTFHSGQVGRIKLGYVGLVGLNRRSISKIQRTLPPVLLYNRFYMRHDHEILQEERTAPRVWSLCQRSATNSRGTGRKNPNYGDCRLLNAWRRPLNNSKWTFLGWKGASLGVAVWPVNWKLVEDCALFIPGFVAGRLVEHDTTFYWDFLRQELDAIIESQKIR